MPARSVSCKWMLTVVLCRIVGFDELPGGDSFTTSALELGMQECGASLEVAPPVCGG